MSSTALRIYLTDHLAGAAAALDLVERLTRMARGEDRRFFAGLGREIGEDEATLRDLLRRVRGRESPLRRAAARLSEKIGRTKLGLDESRAGGLLRLEALEMLGLGIAGKLALWRALDAARVPELDGVDWARLERRAREQREGVEARRLDAARAALTPRRSPPRARGGAGTGPPRAREPAPAGSRRR